MKKLWISAMVLVLLVFGATISARGDPNGKTEKSTTVPYEELSFSNISCQYNQVAYIDLNGSISGYVSSYFWRDSKLIRLRNIKKVIIYLNSPGGEVTTGFSICDEIIRLKQHDVQVIVEASGMVASMAIPILTVASEAYASPTTFFMLHPIKQFKWGSFLESSEDLEREQMKLKLMQNAYVNMVSEHSMMPKDLLENFMEKGTWFNASDALKWGIINKIY